ncbi:FG-GAP repeat domain-containing protein [Planobispora siamensis]|uniref:Repeat domain-containing protein n=1 Tax=Planobispora siamensis TaxID=936338 RepID=A0A8J3SR33_9ACTN|nr:VCBS repeat-containing protein [Planobispora siamensis]GIH94138.1 hypothetical protein Psi01_47680 [Planobispora siamensis]
MNSHRVRTGSATRRRTVSLLAAAALACGGLATVAAPAQAAPVAACATASFAPYTGYPVGDQPQTVTVADFDGDGNLDVVAGNSQANTLTVLLGNGDGTFTPDSTLLSGGSSPSKVVSADFDHDGDTDLAVANNLPGTIAVLHGNGDGTFQAPVSYLVGYGAGEVVADDIDADGHLDLIYSGNEVTTGLVGVLRGHGDGAFTRLPSVRPSATNLHITTGDFTGDGHVDVAYANYDISGVSSLQLLTGNGTGALTPAGPLDAGTSPFLVTSGDLNADNRSDLVAGLFSGSDIGVLLGAPGGGFRPALQQAAPVGASSLRDVTGDGKLDLLVADWGGSVIVMAGKGDGTFAAGVEHTVGSAPSAPMTGDFNRDGKIDIVTTSYETDTISVLLNTCTAASAPTTPAAPKPAVKPAVKPKPEPTVKPKAKVKLTVKQKKNLKKIKKIKGGGAA